MRANQVATFGMDRRGKNVEAGKASKEKSL
jgi:hypothetical protein